MSRTRHFVPVDEWDDPRHLLGVGGERVAMAYLIACGWSIEHHRFRCAGADIDLIARKDRLVAFVEVKTRQNPAPDEPLAAINWRKQRAIARVAECWRLRFGRKDDEMRFDVVTITGRGADRKIEHLADAWRLTR